MANYKQEDVSGTSWHRFNKIVIDNKFGITPTISCFEQEVVEVGDIFTENEFGLLFFTYNPTEVFALFDPDTALPTGDYAVGSDVRQMVYSLIMHALLIRDAPNINAAIVEEDDTLDSDATVDVVADLDETEEDEPLESDGTVV